MQTYERARLLANPLPVPRDIVAFAKKCKGLLCNHATKDTPVTTEFSNGLGRIENYSCVALLIQQPGGSFAFAVVNLLRVWEDESGQFLELLDKPRHWKKVGYGGGKKLPVETVRALKRVSPTTRNEVVQRANGTAIKRFLLICGSTLPS